MEKLTVKQEAFCFHYTNRGSESFGNGRESAKLAQYGCSNNVHDASASRLLRNVKVKAKIDELLRQGQAKLELEAKQVLDMLYQNALDARDKGRYAASNQALIKLGEHLGLFKSSCSTIINSVGPIIPEKISEITEMELLESRLARLKRLQQSGSGLADQSSYG